MYQDLFHQENKVAAYKIVTHLTLLECHTFPSILRLEDDLGVKTEELELAVPNLEDIDEYPEVNEVGPDMGQFKI